MVNISCLLIFEFAVAANDNPSSIDKVLYDKKNLTSIVSSINFVQTRPRRCSPYKGPLNKHILELNLYKLI